MTAFVQFLKYNGILSLGKDDERCKARESLRKIKIKTRKAELQAQIMVLDRLEERMMTIKATSKGIETMQFLLLVN